VCTLERFLPAAKLVPRVHLVEKKLQVKPFRALPKVTLTSWASELRAVVSPALKFGILTIF
jgi:hypothetical protein